MKLSCIVQVIIILVTAKVGVLNTQKTSVDVNTAVDPTENGQETVKPNSDDIEPSSISYSAEDVIATKTPWNLSDNNRAVKQSYNTSIIYSKTTADEVSIAFNVSSRDFESINETNQVTAEDAVSQHKTWNSSKMQVRATKDVEVSTMSVDDPESMIRTTATNLPQTYGNDIQTRSSGNDTMVRTISPATSTYLPQTISDETVYQSKTDYANSIEETKTVATSIYTHVPDGGTSMLSHPDQVTQTQSPVLTCLDITCQGDGCLKAMLSDAINTCTTTTSASCYIERSTTSTGNQTMINIKAGCSRARCSSSFLSSRYCCHTRRCNNDEDNIPEENGEDTGWWLLPNTLLVTILAIVIHVPICFGSVTLW